MATYSASQVESDRTLAFRFPRYQWTGGVKTNAEAGDTTAILGGGSIGITKRINLKIVGRLGINQTIT